jgi:hypothetical protein
VRQTASAAGRRLPYAQVVPSASRVANRGVLAHSAGARYESAPAEHKSGVIVGRFGCNEQRRVTR